MVWLLFSLGAFLGFGLQNFLFKVSAVKGQHSRTVTFYYIVISTVFLWLLMLLLQHELRFSKVVLTLAALDAVLYYATTVTRLEALRCIPVHLAFPLLRGSTVLVALIGLYFFGEPASLYLGIAAILVVVTAWLITSERREDQAVSADYRRGMLLVAAALLTSAGTNVITKLAAEQTALLDYMTLANTLIIGISFFETRVVTGEHIRRPRKDELYVAFGLAVTNLTAWFSYLYALRIGPLSSTAIISGMGFVVPIILAAWVYRERLSGRRLLAILLTVVTLICARLS